MDFLQLRCLLMVERLTGDLSIHSQALLFFHLWTLLSILFGQITSSENTFYPWTFHLLLIWQLNSLIKFQRCPIFMVFKHKWDLMVNQWLFGLVLGEEEIITFHSNQKAYKSTKLSIDIITLNRVFSFSMTMLWVLQD